MQIIFPTDGADLAVAEKTGESERAEMLLHQPGVMVRRAEKILSAPVAAAEAAAVNRRAGEMFSARGRAIRSCPRSPPPRRGAGIASSAPPAAARRPPARRNSDRR